MPEIINRRVALATASLPRVEVANGMRAPRGGRGRRVPTDVTKRVIQARLQARVALQRPPHCPATQHETHIPECRRNLRLRHFERISESLARVGHCILHEVGERRALKV